MACGCAEWSYVALGMFIEVRGCSRLLRTCSVTLLSRAVGVGAHTKAPGALAVACAVGPRGGSGAFLMDYTTCFSLLRFALVRGIGEVLFCC